IEQITFWFSGSYASCKDDYDIKVIQKDPGILEFAPKEHNPASEMLINITLTFQHDKKYISKIILLEKNSDITELMFNDVSLNSKIDKSVWEIN
ncbi:MAG: outer-membrane lipoprotein carrier protein LolA, partial [Desulfobacteraceae bacterium]|nr:outer-membrane lipoprotein carrier protein LolA [Desulfobacteraceae bacterium]